MRIPVACRAVSEKFILIEQVYGLCKGLKSLKCQK